MNRLITITEVLPKDAVSLGGNPGKVLVPGPPRQCLQAWGPMSPPVL